LQNQTGKKNPSKTIAKLDKTMVNSKTLTVTPGLTKWRDFSKVMIVVMISDE
jgi:hypothetical protein